MPNAFGYLRVSHDPAGTSASPDKQRREIARAAKTRGLQVAEWFEDRDISAYKRVNRPGWEALLERLDEVEAVFVWELSRAARRMAAAMNVLELLDDKQVRLISVSQGLDSLDGSRLAMEILFATAAEEARRLSVRVKGGHALNREKGLVSHPKRRFGFDYDPATRTLTVNEQEAELVRAMTAAYMDGRGLLWIAKRANEGLLTDGFVPPLRAASWHAALVRSILRGPHIAGFRTHEDRVIDDSPTQAAILDPETWWTLQAVMEKRATNRRRPGSGSPHLLSGLLRCSGCRSTMARHGGTDRGSYRCRLHSAGGECPSPARIDQAWTDAYVTDWFLAELNVETLTREAQETQADDPTKPLRSEIATLERALERLIDDHALYGSARDVYERKVGEYRDRLQVYRDKLAGVEGDKRLRKVPDLGADPQAAWEMLPVHSRRELLACFVAHFLVLPAGGPGKRPHPGRIQPVVR